MKTIVSKMVLEGEVTIPSSKSDTQRALLLAALGSGKSILWNVGKSKDEKAMLTAIQSLGAQVLFTKNRSIEIIGINRITNPLHLFLSESGLGVRIMASVAALFNQEITLNGEGSLCERPMDFFEKIFPQFKVKIETNEGKIPLKIKGPIQGNKIELDGSLSSQFLSGLLIALPLAQGNSLLHVSNLTSIPYVQMTLNTLDRFGIKIDNKDFKKFIIQGNQKVIPCEYYIEGDWSAASYWLTASALGYNVGVSNLNLSSLQADKAILDVFRTANCKIISDDTLIKIDGTQRTSFEIDLTHCPDLFPALAVFASLTPGRSKLIGINRLIHKESNRADIICKEFSKVGCRIKLRENEMYIEGTNQLLGAQTSSHNDHRIAMSLAILGLFSEKEIEIEGAEAVQKSYPDFWNDLEKLKKAV